jgi:hypothetical protein
MTLEKIASELERVEREIDKRADSAENENDEKLANRLYSLSETLRKARLDIEHVSDILDRKFPTIPH